MKRHKRNWNYRLELVQTISQVIRRNKRHSHLRIAMIDSPCLQLTPLASQIILQIAFSQVPQLDGCIPWPWTHLNSNHIRLTQTPAIGYEKNRVPHGIRAWVSPRPSYRTWVKTILGAACWVPGLELNTSVPEGLAETLCTDEVCPDNLFNGSTVAVVELNPLRETCIAMNHMLRTYFLKNACGTLMEPRWHNRIPPGNDRNTWERSSESMNRTVTESNAILPTFIHQYCNGLCHYSEIDIPEIGIDLTNPGNLAFVLLPKHKGIASNSSTIN